MLYELVSELPVQTEVSLSPTPIIAVPRDLSTFNVNAHANVVYVIDEDNPIFKLRNAASFFNDSCNYFIIISRRLNLDYLTVNVDSVFKMKSSGRFHTLEPFYADKELPTEFDSRRAIIITEDKKSSYNYFKDCLSIYSDVVRKIEPAYGSAEERESGLSAGRSKIYSSIQYLR